MHKHNLKFEKATPHFLFWRCRGCKRDYISTKEEFYGRFPKESVDRFAGWDLHANDIAMPEFYPINWKYPAQEQAEIEKQIQRALTAPEMHFSNV
jgi:hypothetical protein